MKRIIYKILHPVARFYWRIFKPKTFGVKVLITNDSNQVLLVKTSYGLTNHWKIPGGGFKIKKELPEDSAKREVSEELDIQLKKISLIGKRLVSSEGKRDTVYIYKGYVNDVQRIKLSSELKEFQWFSLMDIASIDTTKITRHSLELIG